MSSEGQVAEVSTASAAAPAGNQEAAGQNRYATNWQTMLKGFFVRMVIIYFISSLFRRGQQPAPAGQSPESNSPMHMPSSNLFKPFQAMELYVFITEEPTLSNYSFDNLVWHLEGISYGDWYAGPTKDSTYRRTLTIPLSHTVQNNGSLYLHSLFVKENYPVNPASSGYSRQAIAIGSKQLNKYKRLRVQRTMNLLTGRSGQGDAERNESDKGPVVSHLHPNLTINIVDDHTAWTRGAVPQPIDEFIKFDAVTGQYYPIVFLNDYWNMNRDYQPVNETIESFTMTLTYHPLSLFKWQMYTAQSMRSKWMQQFGLAQLTGAEETYDDDEQDTIKTALLETNPYLLAITIVVSLVHSVFEFLAFKNDIQFWKSRDSLEGLSVRSVFFNVFQCVIVLLYVLDNDTNTLVRVSIFIGLGIEIWKVFKVVNVKIDREHKLGGILPRPVFSYKSTYVESPTKEYDTMAFRYLGWALFPLLAAYAMYSLLYEEHRGWYSWVLSMLYGFLLTFGFIMMTPQLFINYKLKSVAHLPWRMLTYKALNTFIDDLFAFVIQMPTLYRIGCLRDDVIFLIYVYQRYIYRVDPRRHNEYGVSQEMLEQRAQAVVLANNSADAMATDTDQSNHDDAVDADQSDHDSNAGADQSDHDSAVGADQSDEDALSSQHSKSAEAKKTD